MAGETAAAAPAKRRRLEMAGGDRARLVDEGDINPKVKAAQYAVRGEIVLRAKEIEEALKKDASKYPFKSVLYCNIGNPQQLGQPPVTFFRQTLALCDYPHLLEVPEIREGFPADVVQRAERYLAAIPGGTGAYSESRGATILREDVAKGIERRDGYPADPEAIYLTDGASSSVHTMMRLLLRDDNDAILTPIPQYPLYSATIALYGGTLLPYYLREEEGWGLNVAELKEQTEKARSEGKAVRALVVINPGNPTGQLLSVENQREIVKFCQDEGVVLLADEVYQDNIYAPGKSFTSFKKVYRDMSYSVLGSLASSMTAAPDAEARAAAETLKLVSMHSISKGFYGECGRRGGYSEFVGFPPAIMAQVYKLASISLCSNLNGQICMALMMNPPQRGEASYAKYLEERTAQLASLKRRGEKLHAALSAEAGITCTVPEGALYVMPRIRLPEGAIKAAKEAGKSPDMFYCLALLEETGIVTVPGSGFRQAEGTYHFRSTFLVPEEQCDEVSQRFGKFHKGFITKYALPPEAGAGK